MNARPTLQDIWHLHTKSTIACLVFRGGTGSQVLSFELMDAAEVQRIRNVLFNIGEQLEQIGFGAVYLQLKKPDSSLNLD